MLMQDYEVRNIVCPTCFRELAYDIITSIDTVCIWEDEAHLLRELKELRAWVA